MFNIKLHSDNDLGLAGVARGSLGVELTLALGLARLRLLLLL